MLNYNLFSIRIFMFGALICAPINSLAVTDQNYDETVSVELSSETTENAIYFNLIAYEISNKKKLGNIEFDYYTYNNTAKIRKLHVEPTERKKSYGSILLRFALDTLTELGSSAIYWEAKPFDLKEGQTPENMLPKLIAFYQKHGAQVQTIGTKNAQMAYYPSSV